MPKVVTPSVKYTDDLIVLSRAMCWNSGIRTELSSCSKYEIVIVGYSVNETASLPACMVERRERVCVYADNLDSIARCLKDQPHT